MKRLGVLGTFVWDSIWLAGDREPREQWGGIAYSLAAWAGACPRGWMIVPIVRVGADLRSQARDFISTLPSLTPHPDLHVVPELNNRVELRYLDAANRTERLTGGVSGWRWPELEPRLEGLDALYLNFISGYELDVATAGELRGLRIPTYADLHSLFLGPPGPGPRVPRPLPEWEKWVSCFDAVQLNESELGLLAGSPGDPLGRLASLPAQGAMVALLTRGGDGAAFAARPDLPPPREWPVVRHGNPPASIGDIVLGEVRTAFGPLEGDPTGSGDVWGSVLFAGLLAGMGLEDAMLRAHGAAAAKIRSESIARLASEVAASLASEWPKA